VSWTYLLQLLFSRIFLTNSRRMTMAWEGIDFSVASTTTPSRPKQHQQTVPDRSDMHTSRPSQGRSRCDGIGGGSTGCCQQIIFCLHPRYWVPTTILRMVGMDPDRIYLDATSSFRQMFCEHHLKEIRKLAVTLHGRCSAGTSYIIEKGVGLDLFGIWLVCNSIANLCLSHD